MQEREWLDALRDIPTWKPPNTRTVVIVPHPDDEVLGVGGLIAAQCRRGISVSIIEVTDGEAAYPHTDNIGTDNLGSIRIIEQQRALERLGVPSSRIVRLHLPDSAVSEIEFRLAELLQPYLRPGDFVAAPWTLDFHPDHESCGRAALRAAGIVGANVVSYLFWAWHRGTRALLAGRRLACVALDEQLQAAKMAALAEHRSQLTQDAFEPILPGDLLGPARRSFETFVLHD